MKKVALGVVALGCLLGISGFAAAQEAKSPSYPRMAPLEQYRMASRSDEVALARSAAPPAISNDA